MNLVENEKLFDKTFTKYLSKLGEDPDEITRFMENQSSEDDVNKIIQLASAGVLTGKELGKMEDRLRLLGYGSAIIAGYLIWEYGFPKSMKEFEKIKTKYEFRKQRKQNKKKKTE